MAIVENSLVKVLPPSLHFYREHVFNAALKFKLYDFVAKEMHYNTLGYDDREVDGTEDIWIRIYLEGLENLARLSIHIDGGDLIESRIDHCSYAAYAKYKVEDLIREWERGSKWLL